MPAIQTQLDRTSEPFCRQREQMLALIETFRGFEDRVRATSKMEHQLVARRDGVVDRIAVRAGDQVATRAVIVTLVEEAAA